MQPDIAPEQKEPETKKCRKCGDDTFRIIEGISAVTYICTECDCEETVFSSDYEG
jgi:hypothetical protein